MNNHEALYILQHINHFKSKVDELNEALDLVTEILEKNDDDGCYDCKYFKVYSFLTPCGRCKRNYTDQWERKCEE